MDVRVVQKYQCLIMMLLAGVSTLVLLDYFYVYVHFEMTSIQAGCVLPLPTRLTRDYNRVSSREIIG